MEEENRSFSWTGLFIKIILVIIFIIFTVWLLSLSTKDISNSLDVLTDNVFSDNIEKMKKVGKEYYTKEKLPLKDGEIKNITLKEMYEQNLILTIKDKNGNDCNADNSYVSMEKINNEYQMKVYLECGKENDFVIVTFNCNELGTCSNNNTTNSSNNSNTKPNNVKVEYEYVKHTDGSWSEWGEWSDWSKVEISKLDNRDVETKIEKEEYSYSENQTQISYVNFTKKCPQGYKLTADGTRCYAPVKILMKPECIDKTNLISQNGFDCKYTEYLVTTKSCPDGYEAIGNDCKKTISTIEKESTDPICPKVEGYILEDGTENFTCTYKKYVYDKSKPIDPFPADTVPPFDGKYIYESNGKTSIIDENDNLIPGQLIAKHEATVLNKNEQATCPDGYKQVGNICEKSWLIKNTLEAELYCPAKKGYTLKTNDNTCEYSKDVIKPATCPEGSKKVGSGCEQDIDVYENYNKVCPNTYTLTKDGNKCEKEVITTINKTDTKEVTYYRYRLREYLDGTTTYKWSSSKNDKNLLKAGYKLTGRTR